MEPKKDAFGQEMRAFFSGKQVYGVVERDDGNIDSSGVHPAAYFHEFKLWPKHQKVAIKYAKGKVLDVGAGAGRVSLYLQKRGFNVTAIDNSPIAIKICRKRGVRSAKILSFEEIGKFKMNCFDTIIMFGNNFGLFGSFNKAKVLIKKLHKITSVSALIIAETLDPYKTNDPLHLSYHKSNRKRGRMAGQARIRIRFRNYIGNWRDYLLVSKKEMKSILKDTGWKVKKFIDSGNSVYIAVIEKEVKSRTIR